MPRSRYLRTYASAAATNASPSCRAGQTWYMCVSIVRLHTIVAAAGVGKHSGAGWLPRHSCHAQPDVNTNPADLNRTAEQHGKAANQL